MKGEAYDSQQGAYKMTEELVDLRDILRVAEQAMIEARMPERMRDTILRGLPFELSDTHKWLFFSYKTEFESLAKAA